MCCNLKKGVKRDPQTAPSAANNEKPLETCKLSDERSQYSPTNLERQILINWEGVNIRGGGKIPPVFRWRVNRQEASNPLKKGTGKSKRH